MAHRRKHLLAAQRRRATTRFFDKNWNEVPAPAPSPPVAPRRPRVDGNPYGTEFAAGVLNGLQFKQTYQTGDVDPEIVRKRRARNRAAKRSRRINRAQRRGNVLAVGSLAYVLAITAYAIAGLIAPPPASALTFGASIRVAVQWTGGNCWARTGVHPDEHDARILAPFNVTGCHDTADSTQFVVPGGYFGADPAIGDAAAVSCTVTNTVTGQIIASDYARLNDGHNATCLGRWS